MRVANVDGRATIVTPEGLVDVETSSDGRFPSRVDDLITQLGDLREWFEGASPEVTEHVTPEKLARSARLGPVVSHPSQVFAIGLNYQTHAREMGLEIPPSPMVFTKFASSLGAANSTFAVVSERTDWEAELVVVMGRRGRNVALSDALDFVAGYCVGQDLSDRDLQMRGAPAQFSLGKSYENFSPVGPWLTTADEISDPQSLTITCAVNGVLYQDSSTADMARSVAELVSYLSGVVELRPGDLMFTGSPAGVGQGHTPPIFLAPGDVVETSIEALGSLRNVAVAR